MKRFISTEFFLALQDTSQKSIETDVQMLQNNYEEFAAILLAESNTPENKSSIHNALVYTRIELLGLTGMSGEKKCRLSPQSY